MRLALVTAENTNISMPDSAREEAQGGNLWWLLTFLVVPVVIAGLMAYYLIVSRRVVGEFGFPLDDSWIHMRFAENLARGYGFSFNPGEPASTTTGPLWTLVLALGHRITGEFFYTAAALNWLLCWLCAVTAGALARTFVPRRDFGAVVALVVAITVPLPWLALSGMEPPLFMWLTLLGILLHVRLRRERGLQSLAPTVVFALAAIARPECLLLFPLAMLDRLLMARYEVQGKSGAAAWLRQLAVHTPVFLALVAPVFVYNYRVIGRPLPSSYYIKAMNYGVVWALAMRSNTLLLQSLFAAPAKEIAALLAMWAMNNVVLIVPFLAGTYWLIHRAARAESEGHRSFLIPLVLLVQPVAWAISTNFHRTPWFQSQRYVANLGPLYLTVGMVGAWWIAERLEGGLRRTAVPVGLLLVLFASLARQPAQARLYTQNVKNITELQVTTARWVKEHIPSDAYLAVNDVGAIGVITGSRVFDMMGLVSPETLACLTIENARAGVWRDCLRQTMLHEEPDYVIMVTHPEQHEGFVRNSTLFRPIYQVSIDDNITAGGPMMAVYQTVWCKHPPKAASGAPADS